jgi:hypothetical protein
MQFQSRYDLWLRLWRPSVPSRSGSCSESISILETNEAVIRSACFVNARQAAEWDAGQDSSEDDPASRKAVIIRWSFEFHFANRSLPKKGKILPFPQWVRRIERKDFVSSIDRSDAS